MRASLGANLTCSAPEEALYRVTDSSTPPLTHSHTHSPSEGPSTPPAANVSKLFHREGMQCTPQRTSERETPYLSTCRSPADCWRGTTVSCLPPERSRPSPPPPALASVCKVRQSLLRGPRESLRLPRPPPAEGQLVHELAERPSEKHDHSD